MRDQDIAAAEALIAGAENGSHDTQLGIAPETRALLTKAKSDEPLTVADITALRALHEDDLIVAAHEAGRTPTTKEN